jgi:hypothetical protein
LLSVVPNFISCNQAVIDSIKAAVGSTRVCDVGTGLRRFSTGRVITRGKRVNFEGLRPLDPTPISKRKLAYAWYRDLQTLKLLDCRVK